MFKSTYSGDIVGIPGVVGSMETTLSLEGDHTKELYESKAFQDGWKSLADKFGQELDALILDQVGLIKAVKEIREVQQEQAGRKAEVGTDPRLAGLPGGIREILERARNRGANVKIVDMDALLGGGGDEAGKDGAEVASKCEGCNASNLCIIKGSPLAESCSSPDYQKPTANGDIFAGLRDEPTRQALIKEVTQQRGSPEEIVGRVLDILGNAVPAQVRVPEKKETLSNASWERVQEVMKRGVTLQETKEIISNPGFPFGKGEKELSKHVAENMILVLEKAETLPDSYLKTFGLNTAFGILESYPKCSEDSREVLYNNAELIMNFINKYIAGISK